MVILGRKLTVIENKDKTKLSSSESLKFKELLQNGVDIKVRFSNQIVKPRIEWVVENSKLVGIIVFPIEKDISVVNIPYLRRYVTNISKEILSVIIEFILFNVLESLSGETDQDKNIENVKNMLNDETGRKEIELLKKFIEAKLGELLDYISSTISVYLDGIFRKLSSIRKELMDEKRNSQLVGGMNK